MKTSYRYSEIKDDIALVDKVRVAWTKSTEWVSSEAYEYILEQWEQDKVELIVEL